MKNENFWAQGYTTWLTKPSFWKIDNKGADIISNYNMENYFKWSFSQCCRIELNADEG